MSAIDRPDLETGPVSGPAFGDTLEQSALVTDFLAQLRAFADEPAPEPSPELAALLAGATPITAAPSRRARHWRRNLAVAAAVGAAAVSLTGVAAANEGLPQPAQRVVSNVVNDFTPFHINPSRLHPTPTPPGVATEHHGTQPGDDSSSEPGDTQPSRETEGGSSEPSGSTGGGGGTETGGSGSSETDGGYESPSSQPSQSGDHESTAPEGDSGGATHTGD